VCAVDGHRGARHRGAGVRGQQQQRAIERKIRHWKRQASALEAAGLDHDQETAKIKEWQARMRDFIGQTGLQRQRVREQV
jgi:hypothetical protein